VSDVLRLSPDRAPAMFRVGLTQRHTSRETLAFAGEVFCCPSPRTTWETPTYRSTERSFIRCGSAAAAIALAARIARADVPERIAVDYAYYNPFSLILKQNGWLETELATRKIGVDSLVSLGSNRTTAFAVERRSRAPRRCRLFEDHRIATRVGSRKVSWERSCVRCLGRGRSRSAH
jgi:hypothetical protein